jgi:hypothetical protein
MKCNEGKRRADKLYEKKILKMKRSIGKKMR